MRVAPSRCTTGSLSKLRVPRSIHTFMPVGTTIGTVRSVRVRRMRSMSRIASNGALTTTSAITSACPTPFIYTAGLSGTSTAASSSVTTIRPSKGTTYGMVSVNIATNRAYFAAAVRLVAVIRVGRRRIPVGAAAGGEAAARGVAQRGLACGIVVNSSALTSSLAVLAFNLLLFSAEETSNNLNSESEVEVTLTEDFAVASSGAGKGGLWLVIAVV
eukprot:CAMPEP_0185011758 /NCGR_PEP_ID=MMETSP1098-20130426/97950_1 /TAXON_ID=89044 /ORGANISM="Spumella elongata, Strain CCAP 955/1" /LENGTH=215 /DNA_ID=CAMNT_0027540799 /DNA_START=1184 /DNA_END=1832 /DNA_ORIENTATION=-